MPQMGYNYLDLDYAAPFSCYTYSSTTAGDDRTYYVHPYTTNVYQYPYNMVATVTDDPKEKDPVDTEEEPDDALLDEFVKNLQKK